MPEMPKRRLKDELDLVQQDKIRRLWLRVEALEKEVAELRKLITNGNTQV